jgi:tellurite resistance protein TerA
MSVLLTKGRPSVSLSKQGGLMRVNLNWTTRQTSGGGFLSRLSGSDKPVDLDLGCLYEFTNGNKGVVQALGNDFQAPAGAREPIVRLDGDDRSGASTGGENMFVDLGQVPQIRRILVFAYIYEGTPNWAQANGVVTLYPQDSEPIEIRLDEHDPRSRMCAIAMLENVDGVLQIHRKVRYIDGLQKELDRTYGWNMSWTPGRK